MKSLAHWTYVWTLIILSALAHMLPIVTLAGMACAHAEKNWNAMIVFSAAHALAWVSVWFCHKKLG